MQIKLIFAILVFASPLLGGTIDVERYNNHSSVQWVWAVISLSHLDLKGNESILDVGCGDGKISSLLSTKVPQGTVIGIEPFPELIEYAQNKYQNTNLLFEIQNSFDLPYVEQFDIVTSFLTLNWLQDHEVELAISQIEKAMKPGAIGLFTIPAPAKNNTWREIFLKIINSDEIKPYLSLFEYQNRNLTIEKVQGWMQKAAFEWNSTLYKLQSSFMTAKK